MLNKIDVQDVVALAKKAGEAIMDIYQKDVEIEYKADESPLTEADKNELSTKIREYQELGE